MDPISAGVVLAKAGAALLGAKTARPVVTAFFDKMSAALGVATRSWQIKRDAEAEAEATVIEAKGNAKASLINAGADEQILTLAERAEARRIATVVREQKNLDAIVSSAGENLQDDAQPEKIDEDWLANFFDKARLFSNEDIQHLWSQILAGEANKPSSFSRRTINYLANLDAREALLFRSLCSLSLVEEKSGLHFPVIFDYKHQFYQSRGFNFDSLQHLQNTGLISFLGIGGYQFDYDKVKLRYFSQRIQIQLHDTSNPISNNFVPVGYVLFTEVGAEIARICQPDEDGEFLKHITACWKERNCSIKKLRTSSPLH